jgi:hypothetical protein
MVGELLTVWVVQARPMRGEAAGALRSSRVLEEEEVGHLRAGEAAEVQLKGMGVGEVRRKVVATVAALYPSPLAGVVVQPSDLTAVVVLSGRARVAAHLMAEEAAAAIPACQAGAEAACLAEMVDPMIRHEEFRSVARYSRRRTDLHQLETSGDRQKPTQPAVAVHEIPLPAALFRSICVLCCSVLINRCSEERVTPFRCREAADFDGESLSWSMKRAVSREEKIK